MIAKSQTPNILSEENSDLLPLCTAVRVLHNSSHCLNIMLMFNVQKVPLLCLKGVTCYYTHYACLHNKCNLFSSSSSSSSFSTSYLQHKLNLLLSWLRNSEELIEASRTVHSLMSITATKRITMCKEEN